MLENTFCHFRGISRRRELELWKRGVTTWDELSSHIQPQYSLFGGNHSKAPIARQIIESQVALTNGDISYFACHLDRQEHFRIALAFPHDTLFLDIETTGLSRYYDYITAIGWSIGAEESLKKILKEGLVKENSGKKEAHVRREGVKQPMSALLFGPPGTSKTRLTSALAEALGWPLIVVNPSDFAKKGFENVYLQADEIFRDMNDLSAVVVFFDEMDPLMQSRERNGLDTPTQFLTTSMLPQLTQLHDRGQVIFLVATNYISRFDPALMRAGRFDLLLCMGPPTFKEKLINLSAFFPPKKLADIQRDKARAILDQYAPVRSKAYFQLELYMFHEFKRFLATIGNGNDIGDKLESLSKQEFESLVVDYSERVTLKINDLTPDSRTFSKWNDISIPDPKNKEKEIVKYLRDRKKSGKQYG
jgi:ATPase family associated with various cellular activities (AAA)